MDKIDHRRLRAVIKWYAAESGKTQQEIAESLGYSNQSFFSQVLNGYKDIPRARYKTAILLIFSNVAVFLLLFLSTQRQSD